MKKYYAAILCLVFFSIGFFASQYATYLFENGIYLLVLIGALTCFFFILFLVSPLIEKYLLGRIKEINEEVSKPISTTIKNIIYDKKGKKEQYEDIMNLSEVLFIKYANLQFRKWLGGLIIGCLALLGGLFSVIALNTQNKLIAEEMNQNTMVGVAQLKLQLKEAYRNWRIKGEVIYKYDSYEEILKLENGDEYKSVLRDYWNLVVRQEFEVLSFGNQDVKDLVMNQENEGKDLLKNSLYYYNKMHKRAVRKYKVLDTARIIYLCDNLDQLKNSYFHIYLFNLETIDTMKCVKLRNKFSSLMMENKSKKHLK